MPRRSRRRITSFPWNNMLVLFIDRSFILLDGGFVSPYDTQKNLKWVLQEFLNPKTFTKSPISFTIDIGLTNNSPPFILYQLNHLPLAHGRLTSYHPNHLSLAQWIILSHLTYIQITNIIHYWRWINPTGFWFCFFFLDLIDLVDFEFVAIPKKS